MAEKIIGIEDYVKAKKRDIRPRNSYMDPILSNYEKLQKF